MQIFSKVIYSLLFHENDLKEGYIFKKIKDEEERKQNSIKMLIWTGNCSYKEINQLNTVDGDGDVFIS